MAKSGTARYRYETDKGNVFYARTDDHAALAAIRGSEPTGTQTENITFEFSKNALEVGCKPRHAVLVRLVTVAGTPECILEDFAQTKSVVVLTKAHFDSLVTGQAGTTVTIGTVQWRVKTKVDERMR